MTVRKPRAALGTRPLTHPQPTELLAASRELVRLWFGYALLTTTGRDRVWVAMRRLRDALEDYDAPRGKSQNANFLETPQ